MADPIRTEDPDAITAWLARRGIRATALERLAGGASPRTYWRVRPAVPLPNGQGTAIVMALPPDALAPTEHGASQIGELPWLAMARHLESLEVPVPEYYVDDVPAGYILLEDLGDERFYDRLRGVCAESRAALYAEALQLLADWQAAVRMAPPPPATPIFDREHLLAELTEFADMALEARHGITLSPAARGLIAQAGEVLADELLAGPTLLAHRDFQSQNLMVTPRGLVLVDFQDALIAPDVYDLVALLRDSYIVLTPSELDHHLTRFATLTRQPEAPLRERFHLQTIQRKMKDSGRFETLARKGKPHFLAFFADSIRYVVHALEITGRFPELLDLIRTHIPEAR